jgi:hypothetical protein
MADFTKINVSANSKSIYYLILFLWFWLDNRKNAKKVKDVQDKNNKLKMKVMSTKAKRNEHSETYVGELNEPHLAALGSVHKGPPSLPRKIGGESREREVYSQMRMNDSSN